MGLRGGGRRYGKPILRWGVNKKGQRTPLREKVGLQKASKHWLCRKNGQGGGGGSGSRVGGGDEERSIGSGVRNGGGVDGREAFELPS